VRVRGFGRPTVVFAEGGPGRVTRDRRARRSFRTLATVSDGLFQRGQVVLELVRGTGGLFADDASDRRFAGTFGVFEIAPLADPVAAEHFVQLAPGDAGFFFELAAHGRVDDHRDRGLGDRHDNRVGFRERVRSGDLGRFRRFIGAGVLPGGFDRAALVTEG